MIKSAHPEGVAEAAELLTTISTLEGFVVNSPSLSAVSSKKTEELRKLLRKSSLVASEIVQEMQLCAQERYQNSLNPSD